MIIRSVNYVGSFSKEEDCPKEEIPEFAFIGRSNVGKSSLINMLCGKKDLVKVSQTPGKTRTINFFRVNDAMHFVDLPGYGYAKISQQERSRFEKMIFEYLAKRQQLQCVFVLIDSRHTPQQLDLDFVNRLGELQIPFALLFTKADKQGRSTTDKHIALFKKEMLKSWEALPQLFVTSAVTKLGREQLLAFIEKIAKRAD
ncbi:MAG: YihA family ribosome biogenesis GTP-binding protein [Bacteroidetes bacterium]|nr:YihA family ribosome biogenesis GTP-binding protein [Bacteroidota bacterium]